MDCYLVLGIPRDASLPQIRRAVRELCRRVDPGAANSGNAGRFDAVTEAGSTLTSTARRADHDRTLATEGARPAGPAPLCPAPIDLFGAFDTYRPSPDAIRSHWLQNFTGRGIPKSQPVRELVVELLLAPAEAERGGSVPIHVPVAHVCPGCAGTGSAGFYACDACDGHGVSWQTARVDVLVPAGVADGTTIPISLRHLGVRNLFLNVQVRVAAP
jgi:molecular chaperone DnaJ